MINKFRSLPVLLTDPKILLLGGGKTAYGKAKVLHENNIEFEIVSLCVNEEIKRLGIQILQKRITKEDLDGFNIVIDATGSEEVLDIILEVKVERFLMVNIVDVSEYCDFYFSALLQYGNLKIAVSSDGGSPTLSQAVRDRIKRYIPNDLGEISERKLKERNLGIKDAARTWEELQRVMGKVFIIGSGTGDPELLTIKSMRILKTVDIVLYDHLISDEILDMIPENVEKIYAGKPKGSHHNDQHKINNILLKYALEGKRIARLKSGDPFVFGRGAEEAEFLIKHNIDVEIIPGISSAIAGPMSAGIPVTARDYASGFSVVTGCLKGEEINYDWLDLLKKPNHTTILLMGISYIDKIVNQALTIGVNKNLPCAIISDATRPTQQEVVTVLGELAERSKDIKSPAVIVFGEVVDFAGKLAKYELSETAQIDVR